MHQEVVNAQVLNSSNSRYTVHFETLGCRLNQIESESLAKCFSESNFQIQMESVTASAEVSDDVILCLINTCTVTLKAEQKARRIMRLLAKKYPKALIIVTGCYAQLNSVEIEKIDERIITLGGQVKSRIKDVPELLKQYVKEYDWTADGFKQLLKTGLFSLPQQKNDFPENSFALSTSSFLSHSRASLKIQDGCNNNCSYCAIHMARGHSVSIDVEEALSRVIELEQKGFTEVVITTVNIGQYKKEYNGEIYDFTRLLEFLLSHTSKINFRISSLYPEVVDDRFCEVIKNPRVCPHFHISVQSGSNKILKLMNRVYERNDVINACNKLKSAKDNPFLACDIITGFPGETDEDFQQTLDLCKECGFTWIHAFPYSERPGTAAVKMKNKIPQSVSGERSLLLNRWAVEQKIRYIKSFEKITLTAVLETLHKPEYVYHAVTSNFLHCEIPSNKTSDVIPAGTEVQIQIDEPLVDRICKGGEIEALAHFV